MSRDTLGLTDVSGGVMTRQHHFVMQTFYTIWSLTPYVVLEPDREMVLKQLITKQDFSPGQWTLFFCGCCKDLYADEGLLNISFLLIKV